MLIYFTISTLEPSEDRELFGITALFQRAFQSELEPQAVVFSEGVGDYRPVVFPRKVFGLHIADFKDSRYPFGNAVEKIAEDFAVFALELPVSPFIGAEPFRFGWIVESVPRVNGYPCLLYTSQSPRDRS